MKIKQLSQLHFFNKHPIRFTTFTFFVALFHTSFLNTAFYLQVFAHITLSSLRDIFFLITIPIVIFCVIFAFLNLLIVPTLAKIVSIFFFLVGAPLTYFMLTFNVVINHDMLINALGTDESEVFSLVTPSLGLFIVFLGILPSILVILIRIQPIQNKTHFFCRRIVIAMGSLAVIVFIALIFFKNYAAFFRNNTMILRYLLPSNYIGALQKHYIYLKRANLPFVFIGKDAKFDAAYVQQKKKTLAIVVVGETGRAKNFSLNGYEKETNPKLKQEPGVINFPYTSSCGTFTAHSVPCMFSNMTREQYSAIQAEHQSNVIDILKLAGVNILWNENDSGCKGVCDRVPNVNVTDKFRDNSPLCSQGTCYDDVLFLGIKEYIQNLGDQNGLIALHTIGSHGPSYYRRYPKEFDVFKPSCDTNEINKCSQTALINTYNNTILYTDHILSKAINILKKHSDKYNVVLIYMSDHGESLGENGVYLHSMPYAFAPKEQTHIPFIVWGSASFFKDNHIDKNCLQERANREAFSHDNLFHTLLGIFHVNTKEYLMNLDIFSACKVNRIK